jgi:1-pyrroline-5-carboxylate dehydrogenase
MTAPTSPPSSARPPKVDYTFDDALTEANDVPYGLTAGVFSGDQAEVDQFVEQIEAGVIYVNRAAGATTGAWPAVQSFCGWKRSGSMGKGGW